MLKNDHVRNNYLEMGIAACKAGRLAEAATMLEAGMQECDRLNLKDLGTAAILYNLAVVYHKSGITAPLEKLLLRCLKLCRRYGGKEHPTLPMVSRLLADQYYKNSKYEQSAHFYRQALKSPSLSPADQADCLVRLLAIENALANRDRVEQICQDICSLKINYFESNKALAVGSQVIAIGAI